GWGRLVQQRAAESLLLGVAGGAIGVAFSLALTAALNAGFYSKDFAGRPLFYDFTPSGAVVAAGLGGAAMVGLGLGFGSGGKPGRGGRWLVGAQAAVAVALMAVGGLLTWGARQAIAGANFESSHVARLRLRPDLVGYPPEKAQRFHRAVVARLAELPGVEALSLTGRGGLGGGIARVAGGGVEIAAGYVEIGPGYFETLGAHRVRGREFDEHDTTEPVAIVNETLARRAGEFVTVKRRVHRVVGVVKDVLQESRGEAPEPQIYVP